MRSVLAGFPAIIGVALLIASCGESSESEAPGAASQAGSKPNTEITVQEAGSQQTRDGAIRLQVNGAAKVFDYLPADKNLAMFSATMLLAQAEADGTEAFSILVSNFNVKSAELPTTLKLGLKDAMEGDDPMQFVRAPKPLIQYVSASGVKYAGYAEITFESFDNRIVTGRVADIELNPEKSGTGDPVQLADIRFSLAL